MIKLPTLFWLIVVTTAGFAMFAVKYEVQALADQLARTAKQTDDTERSIRALEAEWAYLNRPDALTQMNQRLLSLIPIATKQLRADVTDIPMRPVPPPPPPAPVETVAANDPAVSAPETPASPALQSAAAQNPPAQSPVAQSPTPQGQPTEAPRPVVTAALDAPATARSIKPATAAKPAAVRKAPPHRAASLNELIAQIVESR
jgi:cell division protein FtsL